MYSLITSRAVPVPDVVLERGHHVAVRRQVLAEVAGGRGWEVHRFDAKTVEAAATERLGDRAEAVLHGPRSVLGPPWAKDHRIALAATVMAAGPAATD